MTVTIIKNLLSATQIDTIESQLPYVDWADGKDTAHGVTKNRKSNNQSVKPDNTLNEINSIIVKALSGNPTIKNEFMPVHILYPMLNKHKEGDFYGNHIDRPYRTLGKSNSYARCDVSCSVFLSDGYEGGKLAIHQGGQTVRVKLDKGDAVIYPTSYLHEVEKVTKGERICAVTWLQCAIGDDYKRQIVADAKKMCDLLAKTGAHPDMQALASKIWNNLIRKWM